MTYTITLPGRFVLWFEGTGVALGENIGDDEYGCRELHDAWTRRFVIPAGRGSTTAMTGLTPRAVRTLSEYADFCIAANADERNASEVRAARQVMARCEAALGGAS